MVFRSVFVDPDVDRTLRERANEAGISKGEMFRRYLERGMAGAKAGGSLPTLPKDEVALTLRTVYLPFKVDESLRGQAFHLRTSKSDLIRRYLRAGMHALEASAPAVAEPMPATRAPGAVPRKAKAPPSVRRQ